MEQERLEREKKEHPEKFKEKVIVKSSLVRIWRK